MTAFHALSAAEVARRLDTDARRGLPHEEARRRLARHGRNELPPPPRENWLGRIARQLREPMAVLLGAAAAVAWLLLGAHTDAVAILAIVALNTVIGAFQEGKAARALEELRRLEAPAATVKRGGETATIRAAEVVPGDLVLIGAGDRVPADLRVVEASSLEVDESLLTGESLPVGKDAAIEVAAIAGLGDRVTIAHGGTAVTRGSGVGIAVATGTATEIGRIARSLTGREPPTPLQRQLARLTLVLGGIAVGVAGAVFLLIIARRGLATVEVAQAFLVGVALAVAAVPEGLATVVTLSLALGVRRMAALGAIVRRLPAIETLGSTTVILTDKTGTLTENRIELEEVRLQGGSRPLPECPEEAIQVAVLCNDALLDPPVGDPLDLALLRPLGAHRVSALRSARPRIRGEPFDARRRRQIAVHQEPGGGVSVLVKGAPEAVIPGCSTLLAADGRAVALGEPERQDLIDWTAGATRRGLRVLALARRALPEPPTKLEEAEEDLTLVGLAACRDPIRSESCRTVADARAAGVEIVMVTGDHVGTAAWVAGQVGLRDSGSPLSGEDLRRNGIPEDPLSTSVYARVDPAQKLELVEAVRARGQVVAVTGDGVNDAPALRAADIGVAMGQSGTEVARGASDIVLTDDNLATLVAAVREGRTIYMNIRKVVDYLIAGNLSEIFVVLAGLLLFPGLGVPLLPLQLLWINLLTDGLPALALGFDPVDAGVMSRPPRPRTERLLGAQHLPPLAGRAVLIAAAVIGSLAVERFLWQESWSHARAAMFTVLVSAHLLYAFVVGSIRNRWLLVGAGGGILLQSLIIIWPAARVVFATVPLSLREWALVAIAATLPALTMWAVCAVWRRRTAADREHRGARHAEI